MRLLSACLCSVFALPFESIWRILTDNEMVILPLTAVAQHLIVDWGDGNTSIHNSTPINHVYSLSGNYSIQISGVLRGWSFNRQGDCLKIYSVYSWGEFTIDHTSIEAFAGCSNLARVSVVDTPIFDGPEASLKGMFRDCVNFNSNITWDIKNVTDTNSMFSNASSYNSPLTLLNAHNVRDMNAMFLLATNFNQEIRFNTSGSQEMNYMFGSMKAFNLPVMIDTSKVRSMMSMFAGCKVFDQPINFDTRSLTNLENMFAYTDAFNSPINFTTTIGVTRLSGMFQYAVSFNQTLNFDTSNVVEMARMFKKADQFNKSINFITTKTTIMDEMFKGAIMFNSPVVFTDTSQVQSMQYIFANAETFNRPLHFDTRNVQSMYSMFSRAIRFNSRLIFSDTSQVRDMALMFSGASSFNQPLSFDTSNVTDMRSMFEQAVTFNSALNFSTTGNVLSMLYMFYGASTFNQEVNFNTSNVVQMEYMFANATSFNQPVRFLSSKMMSFVGMFQNATSFNSIVRLNTQNVQNMSYVFDSATNFDQLVNFSTNQVTDMTNMFRNTANSRNFRDWNVSLVLACGEFCKRCALPNFTECAPCRKVAALEGWQTCSCPAGQLIENTTCGGIPCVGRGITGQAGYCQCAPGFFGEVNYMSPTNLTGCEKVVCVGPAYVGSPGLCQCGPQFTGVVQYIGNQTRGCDFNDPTGLCTFIELGAGLQSECVPTAAPSSPNTAPTSASSPTPAQAPTSIQILDSKGIIISPIFNITRIANATLPAAGFVFTLPINAQVVRQTVTQNCFGAKVRCEWQDLVTLEFQSSGCRVNNENVALNGSSSTAAAGEVVGVQCICSHLTVFAIVLRQELQQEALCQAEVQDYILIGLYAVVMAVVTAQLVRLMIARAYALSFAHHSVILLVAVLRIVYLVAKPVVSSLAGLVFLGLLPSALALSVFVHLLLTWASLRLFTMTTSPFAKFRKPLVVVVVCVVLVSMAVSVAVAAAESTEMQREIVVSGSYVLAAMYGLVCVMIVWSGLGLTRMLTDSSSGSASCMTINRIRNRVLAASVGLGVCLLLSACLWVAAVQAEILDSVSATLGVSVAFYVFDLVSLCMLLGVFAPGVETALARLSYKPT